MNGIRLIDKTFAAPEENLACDEALLNVAEEHGGPDVLRFWESSVPFVVLGVAQPVLEYVNQPACERDGVSVLRRCSAGGCVVQGPGSLNYTLVLRYDRHPETQTIRSSYCFILNRVAAAFQVLGFPVRHNGISDLSLDEFKISGNAQRRRKHCFLHHGTLLYGPPNDWMDRYLLEPADRPDYRGERTHDEFVTRIPLTGEALRRVVSDALGVSGSVDTEADDPRLDAEMRRLLKEKYRDPSWHFRR